MEVFKTKGMMCGHCSARVEKALLAHEGVTAVKADYETGIVEVDTTLPRSTVAELIEATGYDVVE